MWTSKMRGCGNAGSHLLKLLIDKTLRDVEAAVLAGRFAGRRAYGYKRIVMLDAKGELVRGLLGIDQEEAAVVRRTFADFASGRSSIQIATSLDLEGVAAPRGGQCFSGWLPLKSMLRKLQDPEIAKQASVHLSIDARNWLRRSGRP